METEQRIILGLMQRGLPQHVAVGIAGNMAVESRFDPGINEISPLVAGSRGGFGLNQWTGPRRRAFEAYAQERGMPLDDIDLQLDYTLQELQTTERGAFERLMQTGNAAEAARVYSDKFLRPGIPHLDRRIAEANRLAGLPVSADPRAPQMQNGYMTTPQQQANPQQDQADFARGYQPISELAGMYAQQQPMVDPLSLYDPYAIAQRFGVS